MSAPTKEMIQAAAYLSYVAYDDNPGVRLTGSSWSPILLSSFGLGDMAQLIAGLSPNPFVYQKPGTDAEAIVTVNATLGIISVAFRGTSSVTDLFRDGRSYGYGFQSDADSFGPLIQAVAQYAKNHAGYQILFTGHSYGGAIAEIWQQRTSALDSYAVTFGSPGDLTLVNNDSRVLNFGNSNDWVFNRVGSDFSRDATIDVGNLDGSFGSNDQGGPFALFSHLSEHAKAVYAQNVGMLTSSSLFNAYISNPTSYRVVLGDIPVGENQLGNAPFSTAVQFASNDVISNISGSTGAFVIAGRGDDSITAGSGRWLIDGGTGTDSILFTLARNKYTIANSTDSPGALKFTSISDGSTYVLANIERVVFGDLSMFNIDDLRPVGSVGGGTGEGGSTTPVLPPSGTLNKLPLAFGGEQTRASGEVVFLTSLFSYFDPDSGDRVSSFYVRDRDIGGGYLMKDGVRIADGSLQWDTIENISRWSFVSGPNGGDIAHIGFQAIDSRGGVSTSAVSTVTTALTPLPPPVAGPATITLANAGSVNEGGTLNFVVTRSGGDMTQPLTVNYYPSGGDATLGIDYNIPSGQVTFAAFSTSATISIQTKANDGNDANNAEVVQLSLIQGSNINVGSQGTAIGQITDTFVSPAPVSPTLFISNTSSYESSGVAQFIVNLSAPTDHSVLFNWALSYGSATATDVVVPNSIFQAVIPAGQTQYSIGAQIMQDSIFDPNESFYLHITNISGAVSQYGGPNVSVTGTIIDDDPAPVVTLPDYFNVTINYGGTVLLFPGQGLVPPTGWSTLNALTAPSATVDYFLSSDTTFSAETDARLVRIDNPGAASIWVLPETVTVGETYYLFAVADAINLVAETNENNNVSAPQIVTITTAPNQTWIGVNANDVIIGGAGSDVLQGEGGNDVIIGGGGGDVILGGSGNDTINGGAGDDRLFGGIGDDVLQGGSGYDIADYSQDTATISLAYYSIYFDANGLLNYTYGGMHGHLTGANSGNDDLYDLSVVIGGSGNDSLEGNEASNTFYGGAGDDYLSGMGGLDYVYGGDGNDTLDGRDAATSGDVLEGGGGNDTYYIDSQGDSIVEGEDGGFDVVFADSSYALEDGRNIELLRLFSFSGNPEFDGAYSAWGDGWNNWIIGNAAANKIFGQSGDDILDGGAGNDILFGGAGNDTFIVMDAKDKCVELAKSGIDAIYTTVSYTAAANIEKISALHNDSNASINLTGNALSNILDGTAGDNVFNGGAGSDTVSYQEAFNSSGPGVTVNLSLRGAQSTNWGLDSFISIENIQGSWQGDVLTGTSGANTIDGFFGADTMVGLGGNDTYFVDSLGDVIVETKTGGSDTVLSEFDVDLRILSSGFVENVFLSNNYNAVATVAIGNAANNVIAGNFRSNILTGGEGRDTFVFKNSVGSGVDTITDFSVKDDTIKLDNDVFMALTRTGVLAVAAFHIGTQAADGNDRIIYDQANGMLWYDPDGVGGEGMSSFAIVSPELKLTNADFVVF